MQKRTLIIAVGLTFGAWVVLVLVGFFVFWGGLHGAGVSHKNLKINIEELQDKRNQEITARAAYERLKPEAEKINNLLLQESDVLTMLLQFEKSAKETGNEYEVSVTQDVETKDRKKAVQVIPGTVLNIKLLGSFASLYEFVKRVEKMPYLLQFMRVSSRLLESGALETSLQIKVFAHP